MTVAAALLAGSLAHAGESTLTTHAEYIDFNHGYGSKRIIGAELVNKTNRTTVVMSGARGERTYEIERFESTRVIGTVYHDWSDTLSTRTSVTISSDAPVFVHRELAHDFNVKAGKGWLVSAGAKALEYAGDVEATAINVGASYYLPRVTISYKYTRYDVEDLGESNSHLASIRVRDRNGHGHTQLWLGYGDSLHELDWIDAPVKGRAHGITLRRFQPIGEHLGIGITAGYTDRSTGVADYEGVIGALDLSYRW